MTEVNYDWIEWKDLEELKIMRKCAHTAKHHVTIISCKMNDIRMNFRQFTGNVVTATVFSIMLISIMGQFSMKIFGAFLSLNESEHREPIIQLEYFVDREKHEFSILIFQTLIIFYGGIAIISTETLIILLMRHISSLFDIVR